MMIRYLTIEHENQDAPYFVGALICAINCTHSCPGCHNQHLIGSPIQCQPVEDVIDEVQRNPFNKGIILSGLEWTEQPDEMIALIYEALNRQLSVMLYTHMTRQEFEDTFPNLIKMPLWCKFGSYEDGSRTLRHKQYGIELASPAQEIVPYNISREGFYWE